MTYYTISNPIGSILKLIYSYNLEDDSLKKDNLFEWFSDQSPAILNDKKEEIYNEFKETFNLELSILDKLFLKLGWQTHYILRIFEKNINLLLKMGLIFKNSENKYLLSKLGEYLLQNNQYDEYVKSIHFRANFWKNNNVIITDNSGIGSGSFIDNNVIITCKHVVEDLKGEIQIHDEQGNQYTIQNIIPHPNENIDLAKIITKEKYSGFTYQLEDSISIIEKVIVFGYPPIPLASKPFLLANLGEVSSIVDNYLDKTECLILSCITRPGNSGGAVINEYGKLVGIMIQNRENKLDITWENSSALDINKSIGYATAIKSKYIKEF